MWFSKAGNSNNPGRYQPNQLTTCINTQLRTRIEHGKQMPSGVLGESCLAFEHFNRNKFSQAWAFDNQVISLINAGWHYVYVHLKFNQVGIILSTFKVQLY